VHNRGASKVSFLVLKGEFVAVPPFNPAIIVAAINASRPGRLRYGGGGSAPSRPSTADKWGMRVLVAFGSALLIGSVVLLTDMLLGPKVISDQTIAVKVTEINHYQPKAHKRTEKYTFTGVSEDGGTRYMGYTYYPRGSGKLDVGDTVHIHEVVQKSRIFGMNLNRTDVSR
jgi:hypothetical protein